MMKVLPRDTDRLIADMGRAIKQLQRAVNRENRPQTYELASASQYGAVATTTLADTPDWDVWLGGQLVAVIIRLRTAGSSNTVVEIYLNGGSIGTATLASGETRKVVHLGNIRIANGDGIAPVVTTAGTGAKGLSVFVRAKG